LLVQNFLNVRTIGFLYLRHFAAGFAADKVGNFEMSHDGSFFDCEAHLDFIAGIKRFFTGKRDAVAADIDQGAGHPVFVADKTVGAIDGKLQPALLSFLVRSDFSFDAIISEIFRPLCNKWDFGRCGVGGACGAVFMRRPDLGILRERKEGGLALSGRG
jgi:hypothetical protein